MIRYEVLDAAGIDSRAGLERFMNDAALYEAVLSAFARDDAIKRARTAYDAGDRAALLRAVHEIKGSCGNVGLTGAYTEASALTALLRSESYTANALSEGFLRLEAICGALQAAIRKAICR